MRSRMHPLQKTKQNNKHFLGLVNLYHIFLKDKANIAESLHKLLHKDVNFKWGGGRIKLYIERSEKYSYK